MIIGVYPNSQLIKMHLLKYGIQNQLDKTIEYKTPIIISQKSSYSKIIKESEMILFASKIFHSFKKIERIFYVKNKEKNLFIFYFVCNRLLLKEEEEIIDKQIEFEETNNEYNFEFMVIRRNDDELDDVLDIDNLEEI